MYTVDNEWKTRKEVEQVISFPNGEPEMTEADVAFLCGVIRRKKPKKLLEIGIAAGGSTVMILHCLEDMMKKDPSYKPQMFSGDISEVYYRDRTKKTGYLTEKLREYENNVHLKIFSGMVFPDYSKLVGRDIDFVLLDTAHVLPGEIMDFLAVLPFLSKEAIICLHDVELNMMRYHNFKCIATNVLFAAACGEKLLNPIGALSEGKDGYPNIAAIRITDDTWKYIENIFLLLMLTWNSLPPNDVLRKYEEIYKAYYNKECIWIYRQACKGNYELFHTRKMNVKERLIRIVKVMGTGRV